jgi:hypothetical protein
VLWASPIHPLERSSEDEGTAEEAVEAVEWSRQAQRAPQPITRLKTLRTGQLLALIAGSHEAACVASAQRRQHHWSHGCSVVGLRCLESDCQIHARAKRSNLQGDGRLMSTERHRTRKQP